MNMNESIYDTYIFFKNFVRLFVPLTYGMTGFILKEISWAADGIRMDG